MEQQAVRVEELVGRVAQFERQRGKDLLETPSSNAPFAEPAPKRSSRRRSGRGPGKQHGTPGTPRKRVEDPDKTLISAPDTCCGCGGSPADAPARGAHRSLDQTTSRPVEI
ncbi:hypothetical protein ACWGQ5_36895 [Streptomyces sp. NPDC055722]